MNPRVSKLVFVVQDLKTKDKETVAVVSGDIHVTGSNKESRIISFQMLLDDNKEFSRAVRELVNQALSLDAERKNGKKRKTN